MSTALNKVQNLNLFTHNGSYKLPGHLPKIEGSSNKTNYINQTDLHRAENNSTINKTSSDTSQKELIKNFITSILPNWQEKYRLSDSTTNVLSFVVKNFLDDENPLRIICALGDEIAIAINESMKEWRFPKWLSNTLYYGLWVAGLSSCAVRAILRGLGAQSWKMFTESAVQDLVAAVIGPIGVVLAANKTQDLFYDSIKVIPQSLINFIRPIISVTSAELAIPRILDPIGRYLAKAATSVGFVIKA